MPNHVHLIKVPSDPGGLERCFAEAHRSYTARIHAREHWTGHLWQGRFSSAAMDERHRVAAVRYVPINPVRAGPCGLRPELALVERAGLSGERHVAQNDNGRRSAFNARTRRHVGYAMSPKVRKRIEEAFGWIKTVGGRRKTRFKAPDRVGWAFAFTARPWATPSTACSRCMNRAAPDLPGVVCGGLYQAQVAGVGAGENPLQPR